MCFLFLKIIFLSTCITAASITSILTVVSIYFTRHMYTSNISSTNSTIFFICVIIASISLNCSNRSISSIIFLICIIIATTSLICSTRTTSINIIFIIYIILFIFISLNKKLAYTFFASKGNTQLWVALYHIYLLYHPMNPI